MTSTMLAQLSVIPALLVILGGMLVLHAGEKETAGRRHLVYLLLVGLVMALVILAIGLLPPQGPSPAFILSGVLVPVLIGILALLVLNLKQFNGLTRRQTLQYGGLGAGLLAVVGASMFNPNSFSYLALPATLVLAAGWTLALKSRAWSVGLSLLGLAYVSLNVFAGASPWPQPVALVLAPLMFAITPLIVVLAAAWVKRALAAGWPSGVLRVIPALALLGALACMIVWASIWDHTSDGLGGLFHSQVSGMVAIGAGMLIAHFTPGRQKLAGLAFALLAPLAIFGAFTYGWQVSYHDLTERRAARIQQALERYHDREAAYPANLGELVPRDLLWLPGPVILRDQGWCYQGGQDFYRLGTVYREFFSMPISVKIYAAAGQPPGEGWVCDERLAEVNARYGAPDFLSEEGRIYMDEQPPPPSQVAVERQPVDALISSWLIYTGSWSQDGRYLVTSTPVQVDGENRLGLAILDVVDGKVCPVDTTFRGPYEIRDQEAWLPDGRLFFLGPQGVPALIRPCAQEIESLDGRYPLAFDRIVTVSPAAGRMLLAGQESYWILDLNSLEAVQVGGIEITPGQQLWREAAWSPTGDRLAVIRMNGRDPQQGSTLYLLSPDGALLTSLPGGEGSEYGLAYLEWLDGSHLLLAGGGMLLADLGSDPPVVQDVMKDIFNLDLSNPTDVSSSATFPARDGSGFHLALRANHPRNQDTYLYHSESGQVQVIPAKEGLLLFFPDGQMGNMTAFPGNAPGSDRYDLLQVDAPGQEVVSLVLEGHQPRIYTTLFPRYLPGRNQLAVVSEQGVSLVALPGGEILAFWELGGKTSAIHPSLIVSPNEDYLLAVVDRDGLYRIPLEP